MFPGNLAPCNGMNISISKKQMTNWIQLITRTSQLLPISTLEISTLSYVVCSFITYGLWWYKPYDIEIPIRVPCTKLSEEEEQEFKKILDSTVDHDIPVCTPKFWNLKGLMARSPAYRHPSFSHGLLAISMLFGGIHLAAWSDSPPTVAESVLWKTCAILSTMIAPILFYIIRSYGYFFIPEQSFAGRLRSYSLYGVAGLYILVRLTLTIEPFVALRSTPVGIYEQVNWIALIPQIF